MIGRERISIRLRRRVRGRINRQEPIRDTRQQQSGNDQADIRVRNIEITFRRRLEFRVTQTEPAQRRAARDARKQRAEQFNVVHRAGPHQHTHYREQPDASPHAPGIHRLAPDVAPHALIENPQHEGAGQNKSNQSLVHVG